MRLDYPLVNCLHQPLGVLQLVEAPEFLDTLAGLHFGRIDVARAVYRDVVNCGERSGPTCLNRIPRFIRGIRAG